MTAAPRPRTIKGLREQRLALTREIRRAEQLGAVVGPDADGKARRTMTLHQYHAMLRRMLRNGFAPRLALGDPEDLVLVEDLIGLLEQIRARVVWDMNKGLGHSQRYSWQEIADGLGTNKSAAHERYGRLEPPQI